MNSPPAGANYWWYRGQTGPAKDSEVHAFLFLLLLFPLAELAVPIKVDSVIGVGWTLFLIVASAFIGATLLRVASVATAWHARERLAHGELPEQEMLEGLLIAVGGGLPMLPGSISDIFGILCLIPFTRRLMLGGLRCRVEQQALRRRAFANDLNACCGQGPSRPNVIEDEYERYGDSRN